MIYGDDVTHVVTEEGVAYLYKAPNLGSGARRSPPSAAPARSDGTTTKAAATAPPSDGLVATPADLEINPADADRSLLAAKSIEDLVTWSGGLYDPPARFRSW